MIEPAGTPFNDALEDLRISGSVLLHECYAPPWAVDIPGEAFLQAALSLGSDVRVVPFHLVRGGAFDLDYEGVPPVRIGAGEAAICPSGAPHRMSYGAGAAPVALAEILSGRASCRATATADGTELICGAFQLRGAPLNPLLAALPKVLRVKAAGTRAAPLLAHAVEMLAIEVAGGNGGSFTASRLLEIFFAEAIRAYWHSEGAKQTGWFKALGDAKIGRAIWYLHGQPGASWSVASLAETIAMSPSRFAARFRETTGQSAMSYVSGWRMNVACRKLRETDEHLAEIAAAVGYQDVAAFSRAFKAHVGESPAKWRAGRRGSAAG